MREHQPSPGFIVRQADASPDDPIGGKARAFAILRKTDLSIPPWFVLTPNAFANGHLHPLAEAELVALASELCAGGRRLAVRSSAMEEDAVQHSFAGQLESFLFVNAADVAARVIDVFRSAFSTRVQSYRREHGIAAPPQTPAVLVQRMVNAKVAGVVFSADPVSGRRGVAVVAASYGVAADLVSGESDSDVYRLDRDGNIIAGEIANKRFAVREDPESPGRFRSFPVSESDATKPALTDAQVRAVAELARRAEAVFARPQDIEWAIEDGHLYLLQSRPITGLAAIPDLDGTVALWDNSNIIESYGGVTTPLTFSFIRGAYEAVYRQFCRIMGVPESVIARNQQMFAHMVGLIRGRVYYNLLNWYRLLALLPGYQVNRRFMEQMMGVKDVLPDDALPVQPPASKWGRLCDSFRLLRSAVRMVRQYVLLDRQMLRFHHRVVSAIGRSRPDLSRLRADELIDYYRSLESELLKRWNTPLVNDFFAMIFYGLLRRLTDRWLGDRRGTLQNDLLCGEGGMISTEPTRLAREMAVLAATDSALVRSLQSDSAEQIIRQLRTQPRFHALYDAYVEKFGDRCSNELELESPTLHDDPLPLFRALGQFAARIQTGPEPSSEDDQTQSPARSRAESVARQKLAKHLLRRVVFKWVLKNARQRVRDRENLRFERTRVFGRVRMIVTEIGRRFYAADELNHPADVFYLEMDDLFGFAEGTACCTDLKGLVKVREAEFQKFAAASAPANRFVTRGMVHHANAFIDESPAPLAPSTSGETRHGAGCCPGKITGRVRIVSDPKDIPSEYGCVLVAERTDPSWILIFPSAAAVLVERGSLLSHSAIVARELGIPTIVSIPGLTGWLKNGDTVSLDGSTGEVTRLAPAADQLCTISAGQLP